MERWKKRRKKNRRGGKECGITLTRNILSSIDSKMNIQQSLGSASAFSWQNSICLCLASFCTPRPNLPLIPGIS